MESKSTHTHTGTHTHKHWYTHTSRWMFNTWGIFNKACIFNTWRTFNTWWIFNMAWKFNTWPTFNLVLSSVLDEDSILRCGIQIYTHTHTLVDTQPTQGFDGGKWPCGVIDYRVFRFQLSRPLHRWFIVPAILLYGLGSHLKLVLRIVFSPRNSKTRTFLRPRPWPFTYSFHCSFSRDFFSFSSQLTIHFPVKLRAVEWVLC